MFGLTLVQESGYPWSILFFYFLENSQICWRKFVNKGQSTNFETFRVYYTITANLKPIHVNLKIIHIIRHQLL